METPRDRRAVVDERPQRLERVLHRRAWPPRRVCEVARLARGDVYASRGHEGLRVVVEVEGVERGDAADVGPGGRGDVRERRAEQHLRVLALEASEQARVVDEGE